MESVYNKDVNKFQVILLFSILGAMILIGVSIFYYLRNHNYNQSDYAIQIVYNYGRNTCQINSQTRKNQDNLRYGEYVFSVIGYNYTSKDLVYNITAKKGINRAGIRLDDSKVTLSLFNTNGERQDEATSFIPLGLTDFGISLGEVVIKANTENFMQEYKLKIMENDNSNSLYADNFENKNQDTYYNIDISLE